MTKLLGCWSSCEVSTVFRKASDVIWFPINLKIGGNDSGDYVKREKNKKQKKSRYSRRTAVVVGCVTECTLH